MSKEYEVGEVRLYGVQADNGNTMFLAQAIGLFGEGETISKALTRLAEQISTDAAIDEPNLDGVEAAADPDQPKHEVHSSEDLLESLHKHGEEQVARWLKNPEQLTAVAHSVPLLLVFLAAVVKRLTKEDRNSPWLAVGVVLLKHLGFTSEMAVAFATTDLDRVAAIVPWDEN